MKLTRRETLLLTIFSALFAILAGGGLVWAGVRALSGLIQENTELAERVQALQTAVDDRETWEARNEWLNEHTESFRSREDAAAALLNHIEQCARDAGMELKDRQILGSDDLSGDAGDADSTHYFRTATIRVKVTGTQEEVLSWMHTLQQPERLVGVTGEVIEAGEEFSAEIDITKSYFEGEE